MTTKQGVLYSVATPIGNLGDISMRAIETLKMVDIIACEDTRTSAKLLNAFNINTKTIAYHDHNALDQTERLVAWLKDGKSIALISDAGTPLISDPGYRLICACHSQHIKIVPIVGACAAIGALSVAGLPSDKFYFYGFLPAKMVARQNALQQLKTMPCTMIFYEAPHRIVDTLEDMCKIFGEHRPIALCRELTKTFETIKFATLSQLLAFVKNDGNQQKGEMVLVVAGLEKTDTEITQHDTLLLTLAKELPSKKVASLASELTGIRKNTLYDRLLELKGN